LAAAAGRSVPLPEAARAFADETPSRVGSREQRLAQNLEQGQPLAEAAHSARLRMGTALRLTVRLAESLGLLGPAMKQQIEDAQQVDAVLREAIGRFMYIGIVVVFMQAVISFMMLKIVPVFQRMFEEFGLKLPALTMLVIDISVWVVRYGWILVVPLTSVILPGFFIAATLYYVGWFPRGWPIWWPLFRKYDGALVMRGLALAIRRGKTMPEALRLVEESYPLPVVRRKLASARSQVEAGNDWRQSLVEKKLITRADAAVLGAAERVGNLEWALDEMAASSLRRQAHRVQAGLQILFPILLLTVGFIVFVIVCGLFMPLISLIQGLS
jgi:type II secretory pathway component PulF